MARYQPDIITNLEKVASTLSTKMDKNRVAITRFINR